MMSSRLSKASFAALFLVSLMAVIGNTALISVMPAVGREIGIPDFLVATIFSLSALLWAFTSPYWARLSDRHGRKPFILLGMAGFGMSMLLCGLIVEAGLHHLAPPMAIFTAFFLIRSSYGVFGSASAGPTQAYIADHSEGSTRVRLLTANAGAVNLGAIVGPAMAPFLVFAPLGLAGPMFVFAGIGVLTLVGGWLVIPRDAPVGARTGTASGPAAPGARLRDVWRDPAIRPHLVYAFLIASAQAINIYTLGFLVIDRLGRSPAEAQGSIGLAMAVGAAAGLLAQWGVVALVRMQPRAMLRWGALAVVAGNVMIAAGHDFPSLLAAFALASFGYGLARPGATAGASLAAPADKQGAVGGAISSIAGASIAVPPVLAVALYSYAPSGPFWAVALLAAGLLAYAFRSGPLAARSFPVGDR
jgi:MFS family permease